MNNFLNKYSLNKKIAHRGIHVPSLFDKNVPEYYFLKGAGCWGGQLGKDLG